MTNKNSGSVRLKTALIIEARARLGWSQNKLSGESDRTVRGLAEEEEGYGPFSRRLARHSSRGHLAGVCVSTISNVERGKCTYLENAHILAVTLGLELNDLIQW